MGIKSVAWTDLLRTSSLVLMLSAVGCDDSAEDEPMEPTVEMFSWWSAPGEAEALSELLHIHDAHYPKVEVVNAAAADWANARTVLGQRMASGTPPDTFQANGGNDLKRWVLANGVDASGSQLANLDAFYMEHDLYSVLSPEVLAAVSVGTVPYAVPMNLHRNNSLFYNKSVLGDIPLPTTFAELLATCETIQTTRNVPCFSMGGRDGWALELVWWENVLVATAGPQFYDSFFKGQASPSDPLLTQAATNMFALWDYSHPDSLNHSWEDAVNMVGNGQVAFTIMGDWAKGMLVRLGKTPGMDFGQVAFPSTENVFVFVTDVFSLTLNAPSPHSAENLLAVMASAEAQVAFNRIKGSIPARNDVQLDGYDVLGSDMYGDMLNAQWRLLANQAPEEFDFTQTMIQALELDDPNILLGRILDTYHILQP